MPKSSRALSRGMRHSDVGLQDKRAKAKELVDKLAPSMSENVQSEDSSMTPTAPSKFVPVGGPRKEVELGDIKSKSIEKHVDNIRYKVVYAADKLADELTHAVSRKNKKDKEYIKGLVWSFGTLYDKLANVDSGQQRVALPAQLLRSLTDVMKAQAQALSNITKPADRDERNVIDITAEALKANSARSNTAVQDVIDVTPKEQHVSTSPERSDTSESLPT